MEPLDIFRTNLADLTSYGLVAVALLVIGFAALDLVTPGSLRTKIWVEQNRSAVILAVSQTIGLAFAIAAGITASVGFDLWKGVLFTLGYGIATIALMTFAFVLVDALTPGRLGSVLLDEEGDGYSRAVWVNAFVVIAIGLFVAAAL